MDPRKSLSEKFCTFRPFKLRASGTIEADQETGTEWDLKICKTVENPVEITNFKGSGTRTSSYARNIKGLSINYSTVLLDWL